MCVQLRGIYIVLLIFAFIGAIYTQVFVTRSASPGCDFLCYFSAAKHVVEGNSPYTDVYKGFVYYLYTPTLAILLTPITYLTSEGAYYLWSILSVIFYLSGAYLCGYYAYHSSS
jgi:hypothetical protein